MFVVELFLPLQTSSGKPVPAKTFDRIKAELTDNFGGVTAFLRSPADGAWKPEQGNVVHNQVAIFEVIQRRRHRMVASLPERARGRT